MDSKLSQTVRQPAAEPAAWYERRAARMVRAVAVIASALAAIALAVVGWNGLSHVMDVVGAAASRSGL